ncbi:hypothetical protein BDZ89DRAFT_1147681 [Hymenopellis radicata]|nr:hypothetical protein BDZ89DRAFT_1147681 [Hymenopellis radicata]
MVLLGGRGMSSIQFYFRRPDWMLIVLDHNVMISFHVMHLARACTQADLEPSSAVNLALYMVFDTRPVHYLEPEATQAALADWRVDILDTCNMTMLFTAVKGNQVTNNGYEVYWNHLPQPQSPTALPAPLLPIPIPFQELLIKDTSVGYLVTVSSAFLRPFFAVSPHIPLKRLTTASSSPTLRSACYTFLGSVSSLYFLVIVNQWYSSTCACD